MQRRALLAVVVVLASAGFLEATNISYGPYGGYWNVSFDAEVGQTFRATSRNISRIGVWLQPWGSGLSSGLRVDLYEESGTKGQPAFTGARLSSSTAWVRHPDQWGQGWADAWFSTVDLVPGRTYSFKLTESGAIAGEVGNWGVSQSTWGSVYPSGVSIRKGIVDYSWEDLAFRVLDAIVANPTFTTGNTGGWTPHAEGTGSVGTENLGGGDYAARLTAGSEVGMNQAINTLADPFLLAFDYSFRAAGALEVMLGSERVARITALGAGEFLTRKIPISDPTLLGQTGALLDFSFDGETGAQLLLDNIYIEPVPEPALTVLLGTWGLGWLATRRRRRP